MMAGYRIGIGCPLPGRLHFHLACVVNPWGWAVYIGPFYVLRVRP